MIVLLVLVRLLGDAKVRQAAKALTGHLRCCRYWLETAFPASHRRVPVGRRIVAFRVGRAPHEGERLRRPALKALVREGVDLNS